MTDRSVEIIKTVLLVLLVASSIALSYELWWRPGPASSLPPALITDTDDSPVDSIPGYIFDPVYMIYHDGQEGHKITQGREMTDTAVEVFEQIARSLRPDSLRKVEKEHIDDFVLRRQLDRIGVSVFLPGKVPMDLWLNTLGAPGDFPSHEVDRFFFYISDDRSMMNMYIPTDDEWYHTSWSIVDDISEEEGGFTSDDEVPQDEASVIWKWAHHLTEMTDAIGESMVMLSGWREVDLSPFIAIPEEDVQVSTHTASPRMSSEADEVMPLFDDYTGVSSRQEPDGSTIYTDGYRSVRIDREGKMIYSLINPVDQQRERIRGRKDEILRDVWRFLRRLIAEEDLADLRLVRVEPTYLRGTLDLEEGSPAIEGYTFHFSQQFEDNPLMADEQPISVHVDRYGVRRAVIHPLQQVSDIQRAVAVTPISALQKSYEEVIQSVDNVEDLRIERIELVYYPAEVDEEDQIIRPAWFVDFDEEGAFWVDAITGDIWKEL